MLGLGVALSKAATQAASGLRYIRDNLKLYMPFKTSHEVKFVGTGSSLFDGGSNCVTTSAETSKRNTTYCFWAKSTVTGANYGVFGHGSTALGSLAMNISNKPFLKLNGSPNAYRDWDDNSAQDDGQWHHWAVYIDSTTMANATLHIDGILQTPSTDVAGSGPAEYTEGLTIGASKADGSDGWGGSLAQFGIWSRALTQTEIQNIMYKSYEQLSGTETQGLENYWKLDADYTDSTGNDNGTNSGSTLKSGIYGNYTPKIPRAVDNAPTARADTIGDGSASFDEDNADYITMGDVAAFSDADGFSIAFWVKFVSLNGDSCLISKHADYGDVDNAGEFFIINDDGICEFVVLDHTNSASIGTYTGTVFTAGTWHHVACTHDGGTASSGCLVYIDGVLQSHNANATGSGFANINDTTQEFRIGAFADDGEPFDGNIAQVGYWSVALTQAQVQEVKEKSFAELSASDKTNLVSYWTLDDSEQVGNSNDYWVPDSLATYGDNLVQNGDLESSTPAWTNDGSATMERSTEQSYTGSYSMKWGTNGGSQEIHTPTFTTVTDTLYKLSYWIYRVDHSNHNIFAGQGDGSGTNGTMNIGSNWVVVQSLGWNKIVVYYTEIAGGSSASIQFQSPGTGTYVWYVDDVKVQEVLTGNPGQLK